MTTKLDDDLKREVMIDKRPYTLVLSSKGLKLTEKGKRLGIELVWKDIVSGDAALATALQASVKASVRRKPEASSVASEELLKPPASKRGLSKNRR